MLASWLTGTAATGRSYDLVAAAPFALGLLVMSLSGAIYTWAVLSSSLGASLGLSTTVIARCGTCLNVGTFLSFLPGLAAGGGEARSSVARRGGGWGALSLLATYAAARGGSAVAACAGVALFCVGFGSSGFFGAWLAVVFAYDDAASLRFLAFATLVGGTAGALGTAALDRAAKAPPRPHAAAYARAGVVALVAASAVGFLAAVSLALRVLGAAPDVAYGAAAPADAEDAEAGALIAGDDDGARAAEAEAAALAPPVRGRGDEGVLAAGRGLSIVAGSGLALLDEASAIVDSVEADDDPAATTRLVALFAAATTLSKLAVGAAARATTRYHGRVSRSSGSGKQRDDAAT
ncbi:hypothetical protein JL720_4282 [Aureococcus anophagefferens]|nr:hypothetical protein JL720_4282 [Aureococcus anophagefferens]